MNEFTPEKFASMVELERRMMELIILDMRLQAELKPLNFSDSWIAMMLTQHTKQRRN